MKKSDARRNPSGKEMAKSGGKAVGAAFLGAAAAILAARALAQVGDDKMSPKAKAGVLAVVPAVVGGGLAATGVAPNVGIGLATGGLTLGGSALYALYGVESAVRSALPGGAQPPAAAPPATQPSQGLGYGGYQSLPSGQLMPQMNAAEVTYTPQGYGR